jgi:hypothetical protein
VRAAKFVKAANNSFLRVTWQGLRFRADPQMRRYAVILQVTIRDPADNPIVKALYRTWLGSPYSEEARKLLHTQYHERERTVSTSISNW